MLGNRLLVLDTYCEVYDLLKPWVDQEFWHFNRHRVVENAVYLIGRQQFLENVPKIREIVERDQAKIILSNPAEGSETLMLHCKAYGVLDLVQQQRIGLIGGGDMDSRFHCLQYDSFLPKMLDYEENIRSQQKTSDIYSQLDKPFKFLFLNGRARPHRKYLLEKFKLTGLLDHAVYTCLDSAPCSTKHINLIHNGQSLINTESTIHLLDKKYEHEYYYDNLHTSVDNGFVKHALFANDWGEVYLNPAAYVDTYFSLVTETVFTYPYSFRTEKIWKPITMGHPWIAVANAGYYRDMRNLGFKTFSHLIDESFDSLDDPQQRIERVSDIVHSLCNSNLKEFLTSAQETCIFNQQHLAHMRQHVRGKFAERFFNFFADYGR